MRFEITVRITKTVILERDGKDPDDARRNVDFRSINFGDVDWGPADFQIIKTEPVD